MTFRCLNYVKCVCNIIMYIPGQSINIYIQFLVWICHISLQLDYRHFSAISRLHRDSPIMKGRKELGLRRFQQLRSYRDEVERKKEIPYSSRIVPRGLSVAGL